MGPFKPSWKQWGIACLAIVGAFALAGGVWTACAAFQGRDTTRTIRTVLGTVDIPAVNEAGLDAYLETVEQRFATLDKEKANKGEESKPLTLPEWLYALLGVGGPAASYAAAKRTARKKDEEQGAQRDAEQAANLQALATAVAKLVVLPKEKVTPEKAAVELSDALPGDTIVHEEEVKVAAKAA